MKSVLFLCATVAIASASTLIRALGERSGTCPPPSGMASTCEIRPENCFSDSACPPGHKCCSEGCGRVCKPIVGGNVHVGERPGTCPRPSLMPVTCTITLHYCASDSDCSEGQKCCSDGCGQVCLGVSTEPVHAGSCPAPSFSVGLCVITPNNCRNDGDCHQDHKCCVEGCNKVCKPALHP